MKHLIVILALALPMQACTTLEVVIGLRLGALDDVSNAIADAERNSKPQTLPRSRVRYYCKIKHPNDKQARKECRKQGRKAIREGAQ